MTHTAEDILGAAAVLRQIIGPLIERIDALDAKVTALAQRPVGVIDGGLWKPGVTYPKGVGVTYDHHFWTSQAQTTEQPGNGCPAWRLAVSRGKTGREGKRGAMGPPGPPGSCRCAEVAS